MEKYFPEAMVTGYEPLIAGMQNDTKDRHVVAAAVKAGAHGDARRGVGRGAFSVVREENAGGVVEGLVDDGEGQDLHGGGLAGRAPLDRPDADTALLGLAQLTASTANAARSRSYPRRPPW